MVDPWPPSPYTLLVARQIKPSHCRVWPGYSVRPLQAIPVPLIAPDPDLRLDLQPMIERIYERSRYYRSIEYRKPLDPALTPEETAWLQQQLPPPGNDG